MAVQHRMGLLPQRRLRFGAHRDIGAGGRRAHLVLRPSIPIAALFITACLGAATGDLAGTVKAGPVKSPQLATNAPSQLDYLVLASMVDSQRPLSMAAYQPSP
jgi:hypothetical protein